MYSRDSKKKKPKKRLFADGVQFDMRNNNINGDMVKARKYAMGSIETLKEYLDNTMSKFDGKEIGKVDITIELEVDIL